MSLDSTIGVSASGLRAISAQIRTVSSNVSNAGVEGYTRKAMTLTAPSVGSISTGVRTGEIVRATEDQLQRAVWAREARLAAADTRASILAPIESLHGRPEDGASLAGLLGQVQENFVRLAADPTSPSLHVDVVQAADTLASRINEVAGAVTAARNRSHELLVDGVAELNRLLGEAGTVSGEIVRLRSQGQGTAELEDTRDTVISRLSSMMDARVIFRDDGTMVAFTSAGLTLPLRPDALSLSTAVLSPSSLYDPTTGTVPELLLIDRTGQTPPVDVTQGQFGGQIGALLELRDKTLPRFTAELDELAHKLARRFEQQGLRLFTDASGNVPQEGAVVPQSRYVGFSSEIRVFSLLRDVPRLVRDGTHAIPAGIPAFPATREVQPPYGDPFTPNPADGPGGFTGLIERVLTYAFGSEMGLGRTHSPAFLQDNLGPGGRLTSPIPGARTLMAYATSLVSTQTAEHAAAARTADSERVTRDLLSQRYADVVGVNLDTEMALLVQLQNAYQANARVLTTAQAVWDALLNTVR